MTVGGFRIEDFDYDLPEGRIAHYPTARRDESRLLVMPPGRGLEHQRFSDVVELFSPGDLLVVNDSRVLPARLLGRKPTGAPSEVLLIRPSPETDDPLVWEALVRPGGKLKPGRTVLISEDVSVEILDSVPGGGRLVRLDTSLTVEETLDRYGHMPLPPYIEREDEPIDRERYQTVYAQAAGSVAAPTAGLHFTPELLDQLDASGVQRVSVTLHVGIGTFRPVDVQDPDEHEMHVEYYEVPPSTAEAINNTRARGNSIWAVGTTAVRSIESAADAEGRVAPGTGMTDLFIRPPYDFKVVQGLLTNFHLPKSTLLMLVAALAGRERTMEAYQEAIAHRYRFYSYGDAMAVLPAG